MHLVVDAIDVHGRGADQLPDRDRLQGLDQRVGRPDVGREGLFRVGDAIGDEVDGGEVEHGLRTVGLEAHLELVGGNGAEIQLPKLHAMRYVLAPAERKVVDDLHFVAPGQESVHDMASDEARAAGD